MNLEGDRLSSLPDDIIHKILPCVNIKEAIRTCVLSSRWRFVWTTMPCLNLSTQDFTMMSSFSHVVTRALSHRNNLTDVYSMNLSIRVKESLFFVKRIMNYAFSHNIQQLDVAFLLDKVYEFPLSLFSSQSLKHLTFTMQISNQYRHARCLTSTWELPALTTLNLHNVTLCVDETNKPIDIFSKCANLKNLTLKQFKIKGSKRFSIVHPRLSNLTLEKDGRMVSVVNVVTPQLQNLTIRCCYANFEITITAPGLVSLLYKGHKPLHLSTEGFHSLEKADICVTSLERQDAKKIICLLQQIHNVHFLTLNLEVIEILSLSKDLILHQPSPFVNLRILKIYPDSVYSWCLVDKKVTIMPPELKSYFLDSSPGSTFTMVLREEVKALKIMAELGVIIEKEKDNTETSKAHLERGKTHVDESHKPKKLKVAGDMAPMKSGWKNLGVKIEKARLIVSKLQSIEDLVKELPASNMAKIQPCLSSVCAKADIAINMIADCMKIQCDENQRPSSVSFHELATT